MDVIKNWQATPTFHCLNEKAVHLIADAARSSRDRLHPRLTTMFPPSNPFTPNRLASASSALTNVGEFWDGCSGLHRMRWRGVELQKISHFGSKKAPAVAGAYRLEVQSNLTT
jgi:hypothetical protein